VNGLSCTSGACSGKRPPTPCTPWRSPPRRREAPSRIGRGAPARSRATASATGPSRRRSGETRTPRTRRTQGCRRAAARSPWTRGMGRLEPARERGVNSSRETSARGRPPPEGTARDPSPPCDPKGGGRRRPARRRPGARALPRPTRAERAPWPASAEELAAARLATVSAAAPGRLSTDPSQAERERAGRPASRGLAPDGARPVAAWAAPARGQPWATEPRPRPGWAWAGPTRTREAPPPSPPRSGSAS